jgi:hypothetical protein
MKRILLAFKDQEVVDRAHNNILETNEAVYRKNRKIRMLHRRLEFLSSGSEAGGIILMDVRESGCEDRCHCLGS